MTIYNIRSSGGDYTSLQDAEDDLSNPTVQHTFNVTEAFDAGPLVVDFPDSSAVGLLITVDDAIWPPADWGTAAVEGAAARCVKGSGGNVIYLVNDDITVERLVVTGANYAVRIDGSNAIVRDLNLHDSPIGAIYGASTGTGNLVYRVAAWYSGYCGSVAGGSIDFYHVTQFAPYYWGFRRTSGTVNCYGCAVFDTGSSRDDYTGTIGGDQNMSSDANAKGTNPWTNITSSDVLENVTGGSEDLHLKSSVDGSYECDDRSGTIGSTDCGGDTVTDWDVGAFEYIAAGGGVIKTVNGLAFASVKTVQGLAIASVKTINGVATA